MQKFKFKATPVIDTYVPELLAREWWDGFLDPQTGAITLVPVAGMSTALSGIVLSKDDVLEMKDL